MLQSNRAPTIRQLQLLSALVESQSISKVAEKLHISQPSVSIHLKKLAEQVGAPLYYLNGRNIEISEAGMAVYQTAQQVGVAFEQMQSQLKALKGLQAGTLRLAVVSTAQYFIPLLLGSFCRRYPNIDVQLTIGNRKEVIERVLKNRDDFYLFSHCPEELDIVKEPFLDNYLVVVAPESHELTRQSEISPNRLRHYPFIMREPGSGTRRSIELFCQQQDIKLKERMTIASNEAIKHSVAAGLGLAILSRHTLDYTNVPGLVRLEVTDFPIISQWYLVHTRGRALSILAKTFNDFMQEEGRSLLARHKYNQG